MNCKNLKYRTKKGKKYLYCTLSKQEITFDNCRNCVNKEYKIHQNTFQCANSIQKRQKCTVSKKYCAKIKKNPKIAKLERNRKSVFTENLDVCIICNKPKQELHEIFCGRNRLNSMKYNFVLPLCYECHRLNQNNSFFNDFWHRKAQLYFECNLGSREDFIRVFGRNYL